MIIFQTYQNYAQHGRIFNTFFLTMIFVVTSILVGTFLYNMGFLDSGNAGWICSILIFIPILIFLANWHNYSLRIAYYKTWSDLLHGRTDRKKLLKTFAKTYNIKDWRTRLDDIKVDGRWNFHAETSYIKSLTEERDAWISHLYQECADKIADVDKEINNAKNNNANKNRDLYLISQVASDVEGRLCNAKSAAETYYQRRKLDIKRAAKTESERAALDSQHYIRDLQIERKNIIDDFYQSASRIIESYNGRHEKYTESAVKIINTINNLHYEVEPIPEYSLVNLRKDLSNENI